MREHRLDALGNDELLAATSTIAREGHKLTAELLAHLGELGERGLHLDRGFASLFEYCTKALGFCEPTAYRRVTAARVCHQYPEAFARFARGELHLSALCLLKKHLKPENARELFEACTGKSARQVEELLAARFPKPDVRDSVRRLPTRRVTTFNVESNADTHAAPVETQLKEADKAALLGLSVHSADRAPEEREGAIAACSTPLAPPARPVPSATRLSPVPPTPVTAARRLEPLSADRFGVHFTADAEFKALLERVRGLASHRLPGGDLLTLMRRGLEAYARELERERFGVGRKPRAPQRGSVGDRAPNPVTRSSNASPDPVSPSPIPTTPGPNAASPSPTAPSRNPMARNPNAASPSPNSTIPTPISVSISSKTHKRRQKRRRLRAAVTRAVYLKDQGQCSFVSSDGRQCSARTFLELDHRIPRANGGPDAVSNLRLLCRAHNQQHARHHFGSLFTRAFRVRAVHRGS